MTTEQQQTGTQAPGRLSLRVCILCGRDDRHAPLRAHHYHQGGLCHGRTVAVQYVRAEFATAGAVSIPDAIAEVEKSLAEAEATATDASARQSVSLRYCVARSDGNENIQPIAEGATIGDVFNVD